MINLKEEVFENVEKKTNVDKDTIISLAEQVHNNGLKDEKTLRNVIHQLSDMTGKEVSKDMEEQIIKTVIEDKVPKDIENMF